ncbi:hypothetical protein P154DRAFT_588235 [Amniculicola lignicola CBS 123094]|uniref:Uncharacterized protein n=1 Tax=Amniculicola lignicola CBS 123094 TaxID=1392246 RepID=A0A6A5VY00_9PLEO|nr:hypothetical protein P154DRAFT_588235 [Amniculicola lignicola CBS 123094]
MSLDFMVNTLSNYEREIQDNGCLEVRDVPTPSLTNKIHPIFALDRWMKGYEQHTRDFYHRMKPALQLASLMITEDCTLPWFHHLTFGHRTSDQDRPDRIYIAATKKEHTTKGRRETKGRLKELAHMISWEFTPRKYKNSVDDSWGATTNGDWPWSRHYRFSDYPPLPAKYYDSYYDHRVPRVTFMTAFQDFFYDGYRICTPSQRYRTWLMFASTVVHELAHAYFKYLGRSQNRKFKGEPRWHKHERQDELGFSWENITFGRIFNPLDIGPPTIRTHCLCSMSTKTWKGGHLEYRENVLKALVGGVAEQQFHQIPLPSGNQWVPNKSWRGNQFVSFDDAPADASFLSVILVIPMSWVMAWFSEEEWEKRRQVWKDDGKYVPPSLGPTFMVVYERDTRGNVALYIATRQDFDPHLDEVKTQTTNMGLYNDDFQFQYDQ